MSPASAKQVGSFVLGIHVLEQPDGTLFPVRQHVNQGVPIEVIYLQLVSFLREVEADYAARGHP